MNLQKQKQKNASYNVIVTSFQRHVPA